MAKSYSLTWLPSVLRAAGLTVVEQPGWKTRGHGDVGKILGVLCHHTAGPKKGNAPSLAIVQNGRPDLQGPLAQLVLGRDGTFFVVAAGRCYHAGGGDWRGVKNGNTNLIGIEAENTGLENDNPWPAVQMRAYERGVAAILKHVGAPAIMAVGHLEYALPVGRKSDPSFSVGDRAARVKAMAQFRARVSALMSTALTPLHLLDDPAPAHDGPGDADPDAADAGDVEVEEAEDSARADETPLAPAAEEVDEQPAPVTVDRQTIENVQARLAALGYYSVGKADGDLAAQTRGAIVAFKHNEGLTPETPDIDQAFLARLVTAMPRPISDARANATAADVAPSVPTVKETWWSRLWAKMLAIPAMGGAALGWLKDNVDAVREQLDPFTSFLGHVPLWFWLALAGGIGLLIWRSQRHAEQSAIDLYRQGRVL